MYDDTPNLGSGKPGRMTEEQLKVITDSELRRAVGFPSGKLSIQRQQAEYYYLGLAKGDLAPPDVEGRSQVVAPVVRNTIEAMLPQLMVKFTGGDKVVEFEPTQAGDEQRAENATDYCNYLFFKQNPGNRITYTWFKDALMQKLGIIKVWWDTASEETREEYRGLSEVELAQIMDDDEVEVIGQKSYPDEDDQKQRQKALEQLQAALDGALNAAQAGDGQAAVAISQIQQQMQAIKSAPAVLLYDITCKRVKDGGKLCVENVPPEEFIFSRDAKSIATARMVGHVTKRTLGYLKSKGYNNLDAIGSDDSDNFGLSAERIERLSYDDEYAAGGTRWQQSELDESQREVWVKEMYLRVDYDGDGIPEMRKITRAGNAILENEVVDIAPFVGITPVPMPHKLVGLSIADLAMEGQKTETAILRATLDNLYLQVNGRYFAVEGNVNLDDLLTSRPGGIVRVKARDMVGRLDQGAGNLGESMGMLDYMKGFTEDSTGWSRQSQGNDPNGIKNETATARNIVTNRADMRVDLIARNFADGFVELFRMMIKLVCQYQDKKASIRLSGGWVDMDPREWRNQFDVTINVGLGVGNKDQQVAHLMTLFEAMGKAGPLGVVTPENVYNVMAEMAKNMGFRTPDKFVTKPDPNQPPPNPMQGEMQIEQMKAQVAQATKQAELELERQRMTMQAEVDQHRQAVEAQQQAAKVQAEIQLEQVKHQMQMELERQKADLLASVQIEVAKINAEAKLNEAQITAATTLSTQQDQAADDAVDDEGPAEPHPNKVLADVLTNLNRPRKIIRGPDGRATGIE